MKLTRKQWIVAVIGAVFTLFLGIVWFAGNSREADEPYLAEYPMADGKHRLRLLRVEPGEMTYDWKAPFGTKLLTRLLGGDGRLNDIHLQLYQPERTMTGRSFSFLFRFVNEHNEWANPMKYSNFGYHFQAQDGVIYKRYSHLERESAAGAHLIVASAFPRRDKTFSMNLEFLYAGLLRSEPKQMKIEIENPVYEESTAFPVWRGEELPITKTRNGMTVRFVEPGYSGTYFHPKIQEQLSDGRWVDSTYQMHIADPTGNWIDHENGLSPFEPVWKAVPHIFPAPANLPADKMQSVGTFRIPEVGQVELINKTLMVGQTKLHVHCVCGGGTAQLLPNGQWAGSPTAIPYNATLSYRDRVSSFDTLEPFVVVQPDRIPKDAGIAVRCRSDADFHGETIRYFQSRTLTKVCITGYGKKTREFTLEVGESHPEQFEFLFETPEYWRKVFYARQGMSQP